MAHAPAGIVSVRNVTPLIWQGGVSHATDASPWGSTLGSTVAVARSSLGIDSRGNVLYAGSMATTPIDLARALILTGAQPWN